MSITSVEGTMKAEQLEAGHTPQNCGARRVLDRVGDKWSMYVIKVLGEGTKRFTDLRRDVEAITPRMLTVTLRSLEPRRSCLSQGVSRSAAASRVHADPDGRDACRGSRTSDRLGERASPRDRRRA